jgi:hypothetical protein
MEMSERNSLCSSQTSKNVILFFFLSSTKSEEGGPGPRWGVVGIRGSGEVKRKGERRENKVQNCVHMYVNGKMIPVEPIPGMEGGGDKGE